MTASPSPNGTPLLAVEELTVSFERAGRAGNAVNAAGFLVRPGEVLGLVGESGCGKSVTALAIMRLIPEPPGRISGGRILFEGRDLLQLPAAEMRRLRGAQISMIFQDPLSALNPVMTIGSQVAEAIAAHKRLPRRAAWEAAVEMLRRVGLPEPESRAHHYPHQISGGQRQRVMIAIGFCNHPRLVIADEPTTALDVTVQQQVLDLMLDLRAQFGTSVILITHDLGVVAQTCDRVCVMYAGRIVEEGLVTEIFATPRHPYSRALLAAVPRLDSPREQHLPSIPGQPPEIFAIPPGCPFHPRCPLAVDVCRQEMPGWTEFTPTHRARCWRAEETGEG
jgi:oligopeptide/dipeptide ABC transporter ATP-binding protein